MKNDWADEIVEAWWDEPREKPNQELDEEDFERFKAREKAALRKAKADGMREAAMMASEYSAATHGYLPSDPFSAAEKCRDEIVSGLKLAASKLSPT